MAELTWTSQVSESGKSAALPAIWAEYVLNDLGVFIKRERRVPKNEPLNKLTGFRVGLKAVPGKDYRAAPLDRNAVLWRKITSVEELSHESVRIRGNQKDEIVLVFDPAGRSAVLEMIEEMRRTHPLKRDADYDAASWMCWRDDDEWTDPHASLTDMIAEELETERFLEPEVVEETILRDLPQPPDKVPEAVSANKDKPCFCSQCGSRLYPDSKFCENCGARVG